jgi:hypothetical protein
MDPSYPLVADVRTTNSKQIYKDRIPGCLYQVSLGNSLPANSNVDFVACQSMLSFGRIVCS